MLLKESLVIMLYTVQLFTLNLFIQHTWLTYVLNFFKAFHCYVMQPAKGFSKYDIYFLVSLKQLLYKIFNYFLIMEAINILVGVINTLATKPALK